MKTLIVASRNKHKITEIKAILGVGFQIRSISEFAGAPELIENTNSFAGNATAKAVQLSTWLGGNHPGLAGFVLADDSGLEVDALNGAPGPDSARFAALDSGMEGNSDDGENNRKLLRLLSGVPKEKLSARFRCVIALTPLLLPGQAGWSPVCLNSESELLTRLFEGKCEGRIVTEPQGMNGFGYDPLFVPAGFDRSFAELGEATKNEVSHRKKALSNANECLKDYR